MITVQEAEAIILDNLIELSAEMVPLGAAIGRVLREDLIADRDFPPYDRVTMDGIAINYAAFAKSQKAFPISGVGAAGAPQQQLQNPAHCLEIMTGAVMPSGADTVIRYEDVQIENGTATLQVDTLKKGQNIHWKGFDRKAGEVVVKAGGRISSAEVGVAATVGKSQLRVTQLPTAIIISTGDELVEIDEQPKPHQIRKSNVHRIQATLRSWGIAANTAHLADDPAQIRERMQGILEQYQMVILSGGVSKGKFDFIPQVLHELGVEKLFHKIKQRPGKPFWFGRYKGSAGQPSLVFALPGNPVSSFMCTQRYIQPWLLGCLGQATDKRPYAVLATDHRFVPDLTYYLQVRLDYHSDGRLMAHPVEGHGSGDLANLADADGFLELPRGRELFKAGEVFRYWAYR
ncbi:MAG: molybdopterin molybdotransferase MoeA [Bacteroidota bacterium]